MCCRWRNGQWSLEERTYRSSEVAHYLATIPKKNICIIILTFEMVDDKHLHDVFQTVPVVDPQSSDSW